MLWDKEIFHFSKGRSLIECLFNASITDSLKSNTRISFYGYHAGMRWWGREQERIRIYKKQVQRTASFLGVALKLQKPRSGFWEPSLSPLFHEQFAISVFSGLNEKSTNQDKSLLCMPRPLLFSSLSQLPSYAVSPPSLFFALGEASHLLS